MQTLEPRKITVSEPFRWLADSARFYFKHAGSVLIAMLIPLLISMVFSTVPLIGSIAGNIVGSLIAYGVVRYLMALEAGRKPGLKTLFAILDDSDATKSILLMYVVVVVCLLVSGFLFVIAGATMLFTTGTGLTQLMDKGGLALFITQFPVQVTLLVSIIVVPVLLLYAAFYFIVPLVSVRGLGFSESFKLSLQATLINWWPFLVFETAILAAILVPAGLVLVLFAGGAVLAGAGAAAGGIAAGGAAMGTLVAILFTFGLLASVFFLILPISIVFHYAAYLNLFESRTIQLAPPPATPNENGQPEVPDGRSEFSF